MSVFLILLSSSQCGRSYGLRFFAVVSFAARFAVSAVAVVGVVIVGETEPAAVAGSRAPPATPGVAPAPIVSQPLRGPFEHAPASTTPPITAH